MPLRVAVLAVLAVAAGWLWHTGQTGRLERQLADAELEASTLHLSLEGWIAAATQRQAALDQLREEAEAARAAIQQLEAALARRDEAYQALRAQILAAPTHEDGPVAPVLRQTLERLP